MIALSHPTGNAFVRALLEGLEREGRLGRFFTTVNLSGRRQYPIPPERIATSPFREMARLAFSRFDTGLTRHETGWACVDAVYRALDRKVAGSVARKSGRFTGVYAYEDGALETFRAARELGIHRAYELPIAYWETARRLLREEAARLPHWGRTLPDDSDEKMERKSAELDLAETIVCPSRFVIDSLPAEARSRSVLATFGSPRARLHRPLEKDRRAPFRVLFAGAMTQRKGLADLFAAMQRVRGRGIQLVVIGTPLAPMEFYRAQFPDFIHERPRAREDVLAVMESCDVLVLPSVVEGRALVQQEAMSCGLPLIATRNAGGEDLIEERVTGWLVPIRAPEAIAARIEQLAADPALREAMGANARRKAAEYTWEHYARAISAALPS